MRYDLNGQQFEPGYVDANGEWTANELEGWDSPELRTKLHDLTGQHGARFGQALYGGRAMTLRGWVGLPGAVDLDTEFALARNELARRTNLVDGSGLLKVYEPVGAGGTKQCTVRRAGRIRMRNSEDLPVVEFEVPLVAEDPRKYSDTLTTHGPVAPSTFSLTNAGNFPTPISVTFLNCTSPRLTNNATGEVLRWDGTVGADGVTLDGSRKTARRVSDALNLYGSMANTSTWWLLPAGITSVTFASNGGGTATITYRGAWI